MKRVFLLSIVGLAVASCNDLASWTIEACIKACGSGRMREVTNVRCVCLVGGDDDAGSK